jgi:hypothetical protein
MYAMSVMRRCLAYSVLAFVFSHTQSASLFFHSREKETEIFFSLKPSLTLTLLECNFMSLMGSTVPPGIGIQGKYLVAFL